MRKLKLIDDEFDTFEIGGIWNIDICGA